MQFDILTIFPKLFDSFLNESLIKKSAEKKLNNFVIHDLRKWAKGVHKRVDDRPYGGGAGMLMMAEPIIKAVSDVKCQSLPAGEAGVKVSECQSKSNKKTSPQKTKVILLSPAGQRFTGEMAKKLSKCDQLIFICGRYEGIDARVEKIIDEKISIGPYVLNGGELAAMVIMETVARFIPGFLGNEESLQEETILAVNKMVKEYPQYTRPEVLEIVNKKYYVPKILLSGDHQKIKDWRNSKMNKE
ncbi:MAG TPA: tRNA (guanosine(37)-N1)-methyltransferase TrmD [bacterium]|nr:tRNA (guanosine(37)-N1)-methyltransferase TrmD [bacterium]